MVRFFVLSVALLVMLAIHVAARPVKSSDSAMAPVIDEKVGAASAPEDAMDKPAVGLEEEKQIIQTGGAGMGGLGGIGGLAGLGGGLIPSSSLGGLGGLGGGVGTLGGFGAGIGAGMWGVAGMGVMPLGGGLEGLLIPGGLPFPGDFGSSGNSGPLPVP